MTYVILDSNSCPASEVMHNILKKTIRSHVNGYHRDSIFDEHIFEESYAKQAPELQNLIQTDVQILNIFLLSKKITKYELQCYASRSVIINNNKN